MARRLATWMGLDRRGATAVETAILLLVLLTFVFGITEFARAIWTQAALDFAVEAAARCAVSNKTVCANTSQTQTFAAGQTAALNIDSSAFSVTSQACGTQVSVSVPFQFAVPNLLPFSITLNATACYPN